MIVAATFREINQFFGEGTIGQNTVENWFRRFKSGDISLKDKEGRDCSSDFDDQALLAAMEEDESLTTRMLAEQFDVDHSTIVRRLKKLGKIWKLAGWVPHELSDQNKADRVRIFSDLLQRNEETPFLNNLVTGDEMDLVQKSQKKEGLR
uniref:Mos1 transposase HTH domain-containing protein n=1 Tax=Acrobeloides nanus TaxID=290746 RepID=A0A914EDA0_9BILA